MKQNKIIAFTVAGDPQNLKHAQGLKNSLAKFHPDLEFSIVGPEQIKQTNDPNIFYRATPYFANYLMEQGYDTVIKLDADMVITGDISHVWEGDFDVATVHNSNPREMNKLVVQLQGIGPLEYQNCGFVVMKNIKFVKFWLSMCLSSRFDSFQYREQDLLNNIIFWGPWKVKFLDRDSDHKWHGLVAKGYEPQMKLVKNKLILPKGEWPQDEDKQIVCWHEAGGNVPNKMNFSIRFSPKVATWLKNLTK